MEMGDWKRVEEVVVAKPSMFFTYLTQKDMEIKHGVRKWFFVPIHLLVLDSPFFPTGDGGYSADKGGQAREGRCSQPTTKKYWGSHRHDKQGDDKF